MTPDSKPHADFRDLLEALCHVWGPSGHEDRVRALLLELIAPHVDETRVDALGNLIAVRHAAAGGAKGTGVEAPRIMVAAHMDEIGVVVTHVDQDGFLRFGPVGGILTGNLIGTRVTFEDGTVGVIGAEKRADQAKAPTLDELFIDVGADDAAAVTQRVGDMAAFHHRLDWSGGRPIAPNHDDRIGCVMLVAALRRFKPGPNTLVAVFSTQEEVGTRGAETAAYGVAPQLAIALDITGAGDTPKAPPLALKLGAGAAVKVKDGGMIASPALRRLMEERAQAAGIPYQLEVLTGGTTDARAMQTSRAGVPAGAISVPTRYGHSPSQVIDLADVQAGVDLLLALLEGDVSGLLGSGLTGSGMTGAG
ncbi:MAG: M20/M25/M40 family metallo-hydrolase [Ardenticatenia bacterium]|nr:M20/M25/M40 family metallo-hydrolase [Ardenticatenia bacterium]